VEKAVKNKKTTVEDDYPVLCGGIFFTLLLQTLKLRTGIRTAYHSESDGMAETEIFKALIKIVRKFNEPKSKKTFKSNVSDYKQCKNSGGAYLTFHSAEMTAFDNKVKKDYSVALASMSDFVSRFIDTELNAENKPEKSVWLVKALLEIIEKDKSIKKYQTFYICEDGSAITKEELRSVKDFCLPAFLLGIWHFIVLLRPDNESGKRTYNEWHIEPEYKGAKWEFNSDIGSGIDSDINVWIPDIVFPTEKEKPAGDESTDGQENDTADEPDIFNNKENRSGEPAGNNQVVNNPFVVNQNQYGNNNVQIGSIGTVTINND